MHLPIADDSGDESDIALDEEDQSSSENDADDDNCPKIVEIYNKYM